MIFLHKNGPGQTIFFSPRKDIKSTPLTTVKCNTVKKIFFSTRDRAHNLREVANNTVKFTKSKYLDPIKFFMVLY